MRHHSGTACTHYNRPREVSPFTKVRHATSRMIPHPPARSYAGVKTVHALETSDIHR